MGIFAQLRDRRLFQIVVTYLAAGWIAMEVVDQLVSRDVFPPVVYTIVLIAYLCGIGAALLIGWYHGEKGEQKAPRSEIAMLFGIFLMFLTFSSFEVRDYRAERMARAAAQRDATTDLSKIAVLYFRDYTPASEYQHVADGLTESLIDELSRVSGLNVVTRNGSALFRGKDAPRDSIGEVLDVGTIVDGTVEKAGEDLRITVRLFDAHTGSEFRSTTIETSAADVLEARDRVVEDVARLLRSWLGEEVKVRQSGQRFTNARAWTLYQRAERARKQADAAARHDNAHDAEAAWAAADSLAGQASVLAPEWPEPVLLRAQVLYRRSRTAHSLDQVVQLADRALTYAEQAIKIDPNHAQALEIRGTVKYWKYLRTRSTLPAEEARTLLASARSDLEEAVRIKPLLASAHSTLSHLLYREDVSSALIAARSAYEADAFLDVAPEILYRLANGNYDTENFDQAERWCEEGAKRFASDYRFSECRLALMTTRQVEPDVDRAWRLLSQLEQLTPEERRKYKYAAGLAEVGGVLARASKAGGGTPALADSARRVLSRAEALMTTDVDPERSLLPETAYIYTLLGDNRTAIQLLRKHAAVNPHYSFEHHWWWRELRGAPEFQPLLAQRQQRSASGAH